MKQHLGLVFLGICILATLYLFKKDSVPKLDQYKTSNQEGVQSRQKNQNQKLTGSFQKKKAVTKPISLQDQALHKLLFQKQKESEKRLKAFSKRVYLDLPPIPDFYFRDVSEDHVAILTGENKDGDRMTLLASRETPDLSTAQDVKEFVVGNKGLFVGTEIDKTDFQVSKAKSYENAQGFKKADVWYTAYGSNLYVLVYGQRQDGQGSYGALVQGDKERLLNQEEYYEDLLDQIKTRPAP